MDLIHQLLEEKPGERVDRLSTWAFIVSLSHFAIMWIAFIASRGKAPEDIYPVPMVLILVYFGTLLIYVPVKETLRWKQTKKRYVGKRRGENFIALWILSVIVMGYMEYFSSGYFTVPDGMWETALGAFAIGGLSSISKGLHDCKNGICAVTDDAEDETARPDGAPEDDAS